jgi:hypothetical protein
VGLVMKRFWRCAASPGSRPVGSFRMYGLGLVQSRRARSARGVCEAVRQTGVNHSLEEFLGLFKVTICDLER